ncbi:hypothetical protein [Fulvivirga lutimaris]|uniref:hypothetical protein n=1 Tax=Fulvivirga lutimaris TaxID=1819566 RepID=UPI0012BB6572|nr:hypothetical protein [Fulvivirga lutimaris]MTI41952.1 hypothetical protein [Fulvivirga lutimaris]
MNNTKPIDKQQKSTLIGYYLTLTSVFLIMWLIDLFFTIALTPDWFLPLFVALQLIQLLLATKGFNARILTNINFLELLGLSQIALLTTENYYHNIVYWVALIPLLIVATAVSIKDAIFWYLATFMFVIINGIYFHSITPHYKFDIYPLRFIFGGSLFLALSTFVSLTYFRIKERQKKVLKAKNLEIEKINDNLENLVVQRTATLSAQNEKLNKYAHINAHEVRAPLASILGLISIIDKSQFKKENHEIIDKLKEAGERLDEKIKYQNKVLEEDSDLK